MGQLARNLHSHIYSLRLKSAYKPLPLTWNEYTQCYNRHAFSTIMSLDFFAFSTQFFISLPTSLIGGGLLTLYAFVWLAALYFNRSDWRRFSWMSWLSFLALLILGGVFAQIFVVRFPADIFPPPNLPIEPQRPGLPIFSFLPAFLAAGWFGIGPALIVGFVTGLARAGWETYSILTPFEFAFVAALFAWCVRQDYRGAFARLLRQPFFAALVAAGVMVFSLPLSYSATVSALNWAAVDYVLSVVWASLPVFVGQILISGLFAQVAKLLWPSGWFSTKGQLPQPWLYSLNRKLLFALVPLFTVGLAAALIANIFIALNVATELSLRQMERAARIADRDISLFFQTGNSQMLEIANRQEWFQLDDLGQTAGLLQSVRAVPFFRQLMLLNSELQIVANSGFSLEDSANAQLSPEQLAAAQQALDFPQVITVLKPKAGDAPAVDVIFFTPIFGRDTRTAEGVLVGITSLASNPMMRSTFDNLSDIADGAGRGLLVDENNNVIYHPDQVFIGELFVPQQTPNVLPSRLPNDSVYFDQAPDGTRRLVLYYPLPGHSWSAVITLPNRVILQQAFDIASPIFGFLLLAGLVGLAVVSIIARRLSQPARQLANAAQRISENEKQLVEPVVVNSEDEIGRAGVAFERMRQKLQARLSELNLLLNISKGVSSSLELETALPAILQGALTATQAAGVRIVLPSPTGSLSDSKTFQAGPVADLMAALDKGVLELTRTETRLAKIENLARARAVLDVTSVIGRLTALAALPLRQESMFYGTLWVGYDQPHTFTDAETNLLTTLAGQASVAIANVRLFEAAEAERSRLSAIIVSNPDAIIVTDRDHRILLFNPAAEGAFELTNQMLIGRTVAEVMPNREVAQFIQEPPPGQAGEFITASGRNLYAVISSIFDSDGQAAGRVCVMRDVTYFKELDEMKSEFVATVSHDLRAPLTYMRGYATMLPMVGALNPKQQEFSDKIMLGIEQMTALIDNLLDLGRIEAGVDLAAEPCRVDEIIYGIIDTRKPMVENKPLTLQVDVPRNLPPVEGDATLLRQAITNLVDNAIKYTPSGGQVKIWARMDEKQCQIAVSDTGVGIAPSDQARLFEKFFRVQQRGSTSAKGSGLGLSIVKSVAEKHGGKVWLESKLGKGSTFFLEIPRVRRNGIDAPSGV